MRVTLSRASSSLNLAGAPTLVEQREESPDAVDGFEFGGLQIRGLKLESIEGGSIHLAVPLKAGTFFFPTLHQAAQTRIPKDCTAFVTLNVGKGENGKLKITGIELNLSDPLVIENPASAFLEPGISFWSRAANSLRDRLAKVHIEGVKVDQLGSVNFVGTLITAKVKQCPLSEVIDIPDLNLDLRHLASNFNNRDSDRSIGLEFLKTLGQVAGEAIYNAQVTLTPSVLSVHSNSIDLQTEKRGATAQIQGQLTLNEALDFSFTADPNKSFIDSLLGKMVLSAAVKVEHPLEKDAHIDFKVDGQIGDLPKLDVTGHKIRANAAHLSAAGEFDLNAETHSATNGSAKVSVALTNPLLQVENTAARVNGTLGATLTIRDFQLHQAHKAPSFKGTLCAFMEEERKRSLEINFRVHRSGRLSVSPLHNRVSHLVDLPFGQAYPEPAQSPQPLPGNLGRITSVQFARRMQKLTNSRITDNNRVELLVDGVKSFPRRLQLIREATDSICLQTLVFQDDECGMVMARALAEAAKRGVKVHVIVDGQGSADNLKNVIAVNRAYKLMTDAGVELRIHNDAAISGLKDILDVLVDNRLTPYSKDELVAGNISKLGAIICEFVIKLQKGELELSDEQRRKFVAGINKGLGRALDERVDPDHRVLPTDESGVMHFGGLMDRAQKVVQQVYSWHEKHFIVDGNVGIWGGMNIAKQYLMGGLLYKADDGKIMKGWRDTDLLIQGPSVDDGVAAFAKNWQHLTGETLAIKRQPVGKILPGNDVQVQIIQHSPSISGDNHITDFLVAHLDRLEVGESAYFENAYFCVSTTLSPLYTAMINAAKRGVQIMVLTNSEVSSDLPAINNAAFHTYRDLMKAGVRIFERKDDRTIHSKIAVLGKDVSIVGSANLDNRSARVNSEVIAVVYDEDFANEQRKVIKKDLSWQIAREITCDDIAAISPIKSARFAVMSLIRDVC